VLKKKMQRGGVFREMKQRKYYEKPSEKRVREQAEAVRRARKLARKKAQREGLLPKPPVARTGRPGKPGGRPGGPGARRRRRPTARRRLRGCSLTTFLPEYTFADFKTSFDGEHVSSRGRLAMDAPEIAASVNSAAMSQPCLAAC
jgi:small subunit ribosomal protein S21